ncbi:hypothetical protein D3C71_1655490 [compost metagenome]
MEAALVEQLGRRRQHGLALGLALLGAVLRGGPQRLLIEGVSGVRVKVHQCFHGWRESPNAWFGGRQPESYS